MITFYNSWFHSLFCSVFPLSTNKCWADFVLTFEGMHNRRDEGKVEVVELNMEENKKVTGKLISSTFLSLKLMFYIYFRI